MSDNIIIAVLMAIILAFLGFIFYGAHEADLACNKAGGAMVRTSQGYECLKVTKL